MSAFLEIFLKSVQDSKPWILMTKMILDFSKITPTSKALKVLNIIVQVNGKRQNSKKLLKRVPISGGQSHL